DRSADQDQGPLDLRERCGSLPDRGCDRVPRDLVGLGHPPSSEEARARTAPHVPTGAALRTTGVTKRPRRGYDAQARMQRYAVVDTNFVEPAIVEPGSNPTESETSLVRSS